MSLEINVTSRGFKFRVEPEKQAEGWVTVEYAATEDDFIENIAEAIKKAYEMGIENSRKMYDPCKRAHKDAPPNDNWSDNTLHGGTC